MGRVLRRKADGGHAGFALIFVEGSVEDAALGAHESFLGEITDVADASWCVPSTELAEEPGTNLQALRP
jgi:hypothetical protein